MLLWVVFFFCIATSSFAQQEQAFWVDQPISYMRMAEKLLASVEQGQPMVQTQLAEMYERGLGVPQNIDTAIELYRKAARLGFEPAQIKLRSIGVSVLAIPNKTFVDEEAQAGETDQKSTMQITINVGNIHLPNSVFDEWRHSRILLKPANKKRRKIRRRPFMNVQSQSRRGSLSSTQKPRPGFVSKGS